jgi:hypothetical protein
MQLDVLLLRTAEVSRARGHLPEIMRVLPLLRKMLRPKDINRSFLLVHGALSVVQHSISFMLP